ncbi:MAG TPA: hypothetical protein VET23_09585 [Chitinophagaceae bacterium]|nr:hypothetical protein [Chitinophagaceae bacterium]
MSQLLEKYLPYLLLAYFLIRSFREPVYLLGIPFLIFFRYCIFFDKIKIFNIPGSLTSDIRLLAWLIISWLIFLILSSLQAGFRRERINAYKGLNGLDLIIIGLMVISIIDLIVVQKKYLVGTNILTEFFTLIALFLGFFIIKNIISQVDSITLKDFFYSIAIVNSIASLLYFIHQGLHFNIYDNNYTEEYSSELFQGVTITRTFWFMPVLWYFSIAYLLVFKKKRSIINIGLILINFLAIFISYTRSALTEGLMVVVLYFIMTSIKNRNYASLIKYFLGIGISAIVFFFAVSSFLPASTNYFMSRINELKQNPTDEESNNLIVRFHNTGEIFSRMESHKRIAGLGPVTESQLPWVEDMRATTADMVWTGVVFRWGYIGLFLFILLYFLALFKAYKLFITNIGILSQLGLLFFLTIVSQIMESFVSWTFMSPDRFALGLWYFGILSALVGFSKKKEPEFKNTSVEYAKLP